MSTWKIDASHSEIEFRVKHLMISTVAGRFTDFDATIETATDNNDFTNAKVSFEASIDSITTKNEQRDNHLKSADFFHADEHPKMHFVSTSLEIDGGEVVLKGDLSMKGVSKAITLKGDFGGVITDGYGLTRTGWEVSGKINRQDFGLVWSQVTEAGGIVVSDEVRLVINAEFIKQ